MKLTGSDEDSLPLGHTVAVCALLIAVGATAAYGVPALLDRTHQTEAIDMLGKIARAAAVYYVKPHADLEKGERAPCQFPLGEIRSSLAQSCCDERVNLPGTNLCDPAKIEWNRTLWHALGRFQMRDPHAFIYEYKAEGVLGDARYTVSAFADLDCDGVISTFSFVGHGDPNARSNDCVLRTTPTFTASAEGK